VLTALCAAPVMACLAPDAALNEQEKACCRDMADDCGSKDMASSHSCCQKIVSSQQDALVQQLAGIDNAAAAAAAIAAGGALAPADPGQSHDSPLDQHPPPITSPSRTVLKI
jgi:hypothetical protein